MADEIVRIEADAEEIDEVINTLKNCDIPGHIADTNNPHQVTKEQVGLGNVDNTSDADKPISAAVQAALDSKQNTLTTAQLAAVNSGITSEGVAQIETNETNISKDEAALAELVDSGAKNKLVNTATTSSGNGVTFTVNSDGTISTSGTATTNINYYYIARGVPKLSGKMILSGCPQGGANNKYKIDILDSSGNAIYNDYGDNPIIDWELCSTDTFSARIRIQSGTNVDGLNFQPMICTEAAWKISQAYQPHRPSYQELYEMVKALQAQLANQ